MSDELKALTRAYGDETISQAELQRLEELLQGNHDAREQFLRKMNLINALEDMALADQPRLNDQDLSQPPATSAETRRFTWKRWASLTVVAATLLVFASFVWLNSESPIIGTIVDVHGDVRWTGQNGVVTEQLKSAELLPGGTLEVLAADAWASFRFHEGSIVTLMAIRNSHVRMLERPSNESHAVQALKKVCWATSSASVSSANISMPSRKTSAQCACITSSNSSFRFILIRSARKRILHAAAGKIVELKCKCHKSFSCNSTSVFIKCDFIRRKCVNHPLDYFPTSAFSAVRPWAIDSGFRPPLPRCDHSPRCVHCGNMNANPRLPRHQFCQKVSRPCWPSPTVIQNRRSNDDMQLFQKPFVQFSASMLFTTIDKSNFSKFTKPFRDSINVGP